MNELNGRTLVVTGGTGWLGQGLIAALTAGLPECPRLASAPTGATLRAMVLPGDGVSLPDGVIRHTGDVRSADDCLALCADAHDGVLFHLAGLIHPPKIRDFYEVNVEGTRHALAAAVKAGVRRAVVMSSNSPLGCNPHPDHRFDEDSPYHPYMNYGRSKMELEHEVQRVAESADIETVVVRAPWFYGPHQPPRQARFFEMIRGGRAPIVGGGNNRRSMTYIENLAQGLILAAITPEANGRTYWIADERPYTMNEIVDTVERLLETEFGQSCTHGRLRLPGFVSDVARLADATIQSTGLYNQEIHVLSEMNQTIACSIDRARRELGYDPKVALEEGMRRSLQWMVAQGQLEGGGN